jgi:hypothetical protein
LPDAVEHKRDEASLEHGHGRSATTPSEIPARGWKDILLRVYRGISDDRILANAGAVTFFGCWRCSPASPRWSRSTACSPMLEASASNSIRWRVFCQAAPSR